jgi:hypothetical protein
MNTPAKFVCLCACLSVALTANAQKKSDVEEIKAVILRETKAFFEIDQKTWANSWVHEPYAFWSFADTTDVNSFSGWDQIEKGFAEYFRTSKPSTAKIEREWLGLDIKIFGNGAYVRFNQHVMDNTRRPAQAEVRILEKVKGEWKIVCVSVIALEKNNEPRR